MLTDTKAEPSACLVYSFLICQFAEIKEKFVDVFLSDASSRIFDPDLERYEVELWCLLIFIFFFIFQSWIVIEKIWLQHFLKSFVLRSLTLLIVRDFLYESTLFLDR